MAWWIWALIGIYGIGFLFVLVLNFSLGGLVSPGLALLRAIVWPVFLATGRPSGE